MPIRVRCKCGRTLSLKDELAGKAIRCPQCKALLKVPAGGPKAARSGASASQRAAAAQPAAARSGEEDLSGLFDEEGIGTFAGPVCRGCGAEMRSGAVVCVRCGLNQQTGERLSMQQRTAEGVTSEFGVAALDSAAARMQRDNLMQASLEGAGLPWWALSIVLVGLVSVCVVGVFIVNGLVGENIDPDSLSGRAAGMPVALLLGAVVAGTALLLYQATLIVVLYHAFKESAKRGLMVMFVPFYVFIYPIQRWKTMRQYFQLLVFSVIGCFAGGALVGWGAS